MTIIPPAMLVPPPEPMRVCATCRCPVVATTIRRAGALIFTFVCVNCGAEDADPPYDGPVLRH